MHSPCAIIIMSGYLIFIISGVVIKVLLARNTLGIPRPLIEETIPTLSGKRLFLLDRMWRKCDIPVLLAVILLYWLLCPAQPH